MFPTLVWQIRLAPAFAEAVNAKLVAMLAAMRRDAQPLAAGQGWQSGQALHERDELRELVSCVRRGVHGILRFLRVGDFGFEITACWATVLAPGAAHKPHSHPNNLLAGVYYVRVPAGADTINFHDPRAQAAVIRPPVIELTAENTDQVVVRVHEGLLLLFPAWLTHSVDANASGEERVSLSFNVMFSSFTERLTRPLW